MMFIPDEGEKAPFHAEPEEGQVAPELPAGLSNEPEEAPAESGEAGAGESSEAESAPEQSEASETSDGEHA